MTTVLAAQRGGKCGVSDAQGNRDSNAACIKCSVINNDDNHEQQKGNEVDCQTKILLEEVSSPLVILFVSFFLYKHITNLK